MLEGKITGAEHDTYRLAIVRAWAKLLALADVAGLSKYPLLQIKARLCEMMHTKARALSREAGRLWVDLKRTEEA